jgi:hypothetical protein
MARKVLATYLVVAALATCASHANPQADAGSAAHPVSSQPMMMNGQHVRGTTPVEMTCYSKNYKKAYKLTGDKQLADGTACHLCHMNC